DQLVAAGRSLAGLHRRGGAPAVPGVLELGVVDGLAVLEDVEFPADQVGGDVVGDDAREDVLGVARVPVGAVVGLGAAGQDVLGLGGVIRRQTVDVVGLDAAEVRQQRRVAGRVGDGV